MNVQEVQVAVTADARELGEAMERLLLRLEHWQVREPDSYEFCLDVEEACDILEPLLRAATQQRDRAIPWEGE